MSNAENHAENDHAQRPEGADGPTQERPEGADAPPPESEAAGAQAGSQDDPWAPPGPGGGHDGVRDNPAAGPSSSCPSCSPCGCGPTGRELGPVAAAFLRRSEYEHSPTLCWAFGVCALGAYCIEQSLDMEARAAQAKIELDVAESFDRSRVPDRRTAAVVDFLTRAVDGALRSREIRAREAMEAAQTAARRRAEDALHAMEFFRHCLDTLKEISGDLRASRVGFAAEAAPAKPSA